MILTGLRTPQERAAIETVKSRLLGDLAYAAIELPMGDMWCGHIRDRIRLAISDCCIALEADGREQDKLARVRAETARHAIAGGGVVVGNAGSGEGR